MYLNILNRKFGDQKYFDMSSTSNGKFILTSTNSADSTTSTITVDLTSETPAVIENLNSLTPEAAAASKNYKAGGPMEVFYSLFVGGYNLVWDNL